MVLQLLNNLKTLAINTLGVNMSAYGSIEDFNSKKNIQYPYVNFDIISSYINFGSVKNTIRVYVMDRNINPLQSYDKCEIILDRLLKDSELQIEEYTANNFTYEFADQVDGFFADIEVEVGNYFDCTTYTNNFTILTDGDYIKNNE